MDGIFLDNNSTTLLDDEVIEAMLSCQRKKLGNPASQHEFGRAARRILENARDRIGALLFLGDGDQAVFTSGGTEANNLSLFGIFPPGVDQSGSNLVSTSIEHPSLLAAFDWMRKQGTDVRLVDPDESGRIDSRKFLAQVDTNTRWVSCMAGNNETGVIQPIHEIARFCDGQGIPFHVDAVQAVGKIPFDFSIDGISTATLSAHKIHGPVGVGALLIKKGLVLTPMFHGGFQQGGLRPGTESIVLAVGFATAVEKAISNLDANRNQLAGLRDQLELRLTESIPDLFVNGSSVERLPHTTNISFLGIDRQQFILAADMHKIAVSTGSACSSGSSQPSHVLTAMNCPKNRIESAIRFGVSIQNQPSEIERASSMIGGICDNLRRQK